MASVLQSVEGTGVKCTFGVARVTDWDLSMMKRKKAGRKERKRKNKKRRKDITYIGNDREKPHKHNKPNISRQPPFRVVCFPGHCPWSGATCSDNDNSRPLDKRVPSDLGRHPAPRIYQPVQFSPVPFHKSRSFGSLGHMENKCIWIRVGFRFFTYCLFNNAVPSWRLNVAWDLHVRYLGDERVNARIANSVTSLT